MYFRALIVVRRNLPKVLFRLSLRCDNAERTFFHSERFGNGKTCACPEPEQESRDHKHSFVLKDVLRILFLTRNAFFNRLILIPNDPKTSMCLYVFFLVPGVGGVKPPKSLVYTPLSVFVSVNDSKCT